MATTTTAVKVSELTNARLPIDKQSLFLLTNTSLLTSNKLTYSNLSSLLNNDLNGGNSTAELATKITQLNTKVEGHTTNIASLTTKTNTLDNKIIGLCASIDLLSADVFGEDKLSAQIYKNTTSITTINSKIGNTAITGSITQNISDLKKFTTTQATDEKFGLIKTGFVDTAKINNYAVKLDGNGRAYVNVPNSSISDDRVSALANISSYYVGIKEIAGANVEYSIPLLNSADITVLLKYVYADDDSLSNKLSILTELVYDHDDYLCAIVVFDEETEQPISGVIYDMILSTDGISSYVKNLTLSTDSISSYVTNLNTKVENIFKTADITTEETSITAGDTLTVRCNITSDTGYIPLSIGEISMTGSKLTNVVIGNRWIDNNSTTHTKQACFIVENTGSLTAKLTITANIILLKLST